MKQPPIRFNNFVHLHTHSWYSHSDALASPKAIVEKAKQLGSPAIGISEHGSLRSAYEFHVECESQDIKCIHGVEFYYCDQHDDRVKGESNRHILLIATNAVGWQNLKELSGIAARHGFYRNPRIDLDLLKKFNEGLICTTACVNGPLAEPLNNKKLDKKTRVQTALYHYRKLKEIFGDRLFLEMQLHDLGIQHASNKFVMKLHEKHDTPLLLACDAHYANHDDCEAHDILVRSARNQTIKDNDGKLCYTTDQLWLKSDKELGDTWKQDTYKYIPRKILQDSFANTRRIADLMESYDIYRKKDTYPVYTQIEDIGLSNIKFLAKVALAGLKDKGLSKRPGYIDRLKTEIRAIKKSGFVDYFLMIWDIAEYAKKNGILMSPSRGCLSGDTPIVTSNGHNKPIKDLMVGETVCTINGTSKSIEKKFEYECDERLLKINTFLGDFNGMKLTKDHRVYSEKHILESGSRKRFRKPIGNLNWVKAEELKIDDWLFVPYPVIKTMGRRGPYDLSSVKNKNLIRHDDTFVYDYRNNGREIRKEYHSKHPRYLQLDERFFRLIGNFVANGWLNKNERNLNKVGLCFHSEHKDKITDCLLYLDELGIKYSLVKSKTSKLLQINCRTQVFFLLFKKLFKNYKYTSSSKYAPRFVLNSCPDLTKSFLVGYYECDGHFSKHTAKAITVSYTLATQLRHLLLKIGIPSTLSLDSRKDDREAFKNSKDAYEITCPLNKSIGASRDAKARYQWHPIRNGILVKIKSIEEVSNPTSKVYDLRVKDNHNYLTSTSLVHNSMTGSLVFYCAKVSHIDPIEYNLPFERFLNPGERVSPPDADLDFQSTRRVEILDYIKDKYGEDKVCHIITTNKLNVKNVTKDVARVLEVPYVTVNDITTELPIKFMDFADHEEYEGKLDQLEELFEEYPSLEKYSKKLCGTPSHPGVHAAGLLVTPTRTEDWIPTANVAGKDGQGRKICCEWDMHTIEDIDLLKIDVLGLSVLDCISEALKLIKDKNEVERIANYQVEPNDRRVFELFQKGLNAGVFQFNSSTAIKMCKGIQPTTLHDLVAATSLGRTAVMQMGFHEEYIKRLNGQSEIEKYHPIVDRLLEPYLGIGFLQETIMQITIDFAGFTYLEADSLRKAMKHKSADEFKVYEKKFLVAAAENSNEETAQKVWDFVLKFSEYGFSLLHATPYALLGYITNYIKCYHPSEFYCGFLSTRSADQKIEEHVVPLIHEAKKMGIRILRPDINHSYGSYRPVKKKNAILIGFNSVKGIGPKEIEKISKARKDGKFLSIKGFMERTKIGTQSIAALLNAGCLDKYELEWPSIGQRMRIGYDRYTERRVWARKKCESREEKLECIKFIKRSDAKATVEQSKYQGEIKAFGFILSLAKLFKTYKYFYDEFEVYDPSNGFSERFVQFPFAGILISKDHRVANFITMGGAIVNVYFTVNVHAVTTAKVGELWAGPILHIDDDKATIRSKSKKYNLYLQRHDHLLERFKI